MNLSELFIEKAKISSCNIFECYTIEESIPYIIKLAEDKSPCELLDDEDTPKGELSKNNLPTRLQSLIAAPSFESALYDKLKNACNIKDIDCINNNLRARLAGIDIGISHAILGVAETGSCLVNVTDDDTRLATMISEIHVLLLYKSTIKSTLISVANDLRTLMNSQSSSYSLFVTGPSKTSDIERIAAIGVHGPLEVHIILIDDTVEKD